MTPPRDMFDMELADTIQAELLRARLRSSISTNGLVDEDEYTEILAREIERVKAMRLKQARKREEEARKQRLIEAGLLKGKKGQPSP